MFTIGIIKFTKLNHNILKELNNMKLLRLIFFNDSQHVIPESKKYTNLCGHLR